MDDWATNMKLNESKNILHNRPAPGLSDREELELLIAREKEAQKYRTFKQWVKKREMIEEKERLLRLLERRELMQTKQFEIAQRQENVEQELKMWSQKKESQRFN